MKTLKLLFLLLAVLPLSANADEISLGNYITYIGKVDANNQPIGKGKLEVVCRQQPDFRKDVLEGVFSNGVVTNAKLALEKFNGPLWINNSTFKGTVEYSISKDGSSITYKLTQGKIKDGGITSIAVNDYPLVIKRIPSSDSWEAKPFLGNVTPLAYNPNIADILVPLDPSILGNEENILQAELFTLNKNWRLTSERADVVSYPNGLKIFRTGAYTICQYPNGDTFKYLSRNEGIGNNLIEYRKTFPDAEVIYENNTVKVFYSDGGTYEGTLNYGKEETITNIFQSLMQANDMASSGVTYNNGTLVRNGQSIAYYSGKTKEEIEYEEKLQHERAIQAEIAQEKKRKEDEEPIRKKYGVLNDEDGNYFVSTILKAQNGSDYAWAMAGHMLRYGLSVKTDIKLAVEYIKMAMESSDELASDFGKMFMADILWTGVPGVVRNQKKAIELYGSLIYSNSYLKCDLLDAGIYHLYLKECYYRCAIVIENGQFGYTKNIDAAINLYRLCIESLGKDAEDNVMYGFAKYRLGYYIEMGRYRAIKNRYGVYVPNIQKAREYYREAVAYGDARTKSLAKQGLQRIGY